MKTIDILYSVPLDITIGPTGTLKRLLKDRDLFISKGYDLTLFAPGSFGINSISPLSPQSVIDTPNRYFKNRVKSLISKSFFLSALYIYWGYFQTNKITKRYLKLHRSPDIIQFHDYIQCYQYIINTSKSRVPIVCFLHSDAIPFKMELIYYPKLKGTFVEHWFNKIHQRIVNTVNKFAFIAEIGMNNYLSMNPSITKNRAALVVNGINDYTEEEKNNILKIGSPSPIRYNLICVGTLNNRKGQHLIIESLFRLEQNTRNKFHLSLVGDGLERFSLEKMVQEYKMSDIVSFIGNVANNQVYLQLAKCNIFILMSYNEGLPISIIEAMRSSLPIITTNTSGMPEVVRNGFNGVLIDVDVNQLTNLFINMDNYDWHQMGINSRARFEKELSFARMREDYLNMMNSLR